MVTIRYTLVGSLLILIIALYALCYYLIKRGRFPMFRPLPGLLAIDECIGRATEMGRPVLFTAGRGELYESGVGTILAGFAILSKVAEECVKKNTELIVGIGTAAHIPIITSIVEQAYLAGGAPENFKPENLIFQGGTQYSQIAGICGILENRRPAAFIATGGFAADVCTLGVVARGVGALSISGLTNYYQFPYAVAAYDYWLLGEDLLAASASITKEPGQVANIWSGDLFRFILVGIIILGFIISWLGFDLFIKYFKP